MRIVYLHQYFKTPAMSGGTRSYEMARRLVLRGHEVHMVTSRAGSGTRGWSVETIDGINVHWLALDYSSHMSYRRRIWTFLRFAVRAAGRAVQVKGDVIFASSTPLTIAIPALVAQGVRRIPLVFEVRDLWPEAPIAMGALKSRPLRWAATWLEKTAYRASSAVVALSDGMAEGVRRAGYSGPLNVIPNSCDNELFDVDEELGNSYRRQRPWLQERKLVLYAGALGRVNGVDYMVRLAAAYRDLDPDVRFLVVGDGPEAERVRALAIEHNVLNDTFFMERPLPKTQMPEVHAAATVCASWVIPIRELEANSANKFFDALAAGRPVVINYGGWQARLISEHRVGVRLDDADLELAAKTLHEFLRNDQVVQRAGHNAKALGRSKFDREELASRLATVLEAAPTRGDSR